MKTRIKVVTLKSGTKYYYPQVREFFLWWHLGSHKLWFYTLTEAQEQIDRYRGSKVQNISYIK